MEWLYFVQRNSKTAVASYGFGRKAATQIRDNKDSILDKLQSDILKAKYRSRIRCMYSIVDAKVDGLRGRLKDLKPSQVKEFKDELHARILKNPDAWKQVRAWLLEKN